MPAAIAPADQIMRVNDILARLNISRSTLCRWRRDGTIPEARQIGPGVVGWRRSVIDAWLADRPEA